MIEILLLSGTFMIIILLFVMWLALNMKKWAEEKEIESQKRFDELTERINETQALFKKEVTEILKNITKILPTSSNDKNNIQY